VPGKVNIGSFGSSFSLRQFRASFDNGTLTSLFVFSMIVRTNFVFPSDARNTLFHVSARTSPKRNPAKQEKINAFFTSVLAQSAVKATTFDVAYESANAQLVMHSSGQNLDVIPLDKRRAYDTMELAMRIDQLTTKPVPLTMRSVNVEGVSYALLRTIGTDTTYELAVTDSIRRDSVQRKKAPPPVPIVHNHPRRIFRQVYTIPEIHPAIYPDGRVARKNCKEKYYKKLLSTV
jgi:hypothetical protein